ncbi:hypothetical protein NMY22_g16104 [Coprinellus aureogranulatus]|nr:hypothetical protein NMY22_g16104 [Coprinellus aureogranulatus]
MDSLSEDLLVTILLESLPPLEESFMTCDHIGVVASHVSKRWRQISLSTPLLWTNIHLRTVRPASLDVEHQDSWRKRMLMLVDTTRAWITRSKECPLNIILYFGIDSRDFPVAARSSSLDMYNHLLELVCYVSNRWKTVKATLAIGGTQTPHTPIRIVQSIGAEDVFLLTRIHIEIYPPRHLYRYMSAHWPATGNGAYMGNQLRSVRLPHLDTAWCQVSVNWAALTELICDGMHETKLRIPVGYTDICAGPKAVLGLLKNCPNLVRCHLEVEREPLTGDRIDDPCGGIQPVELPYLRLLSLRGWLYHHELPAMLSLPSLQDLRLYFIDRRSEIDTSAFWAWLTRYGTRITAIEFNMDRIFDTEGMIDVLQSLPNLVRLHVETADENVYRILLVNLIHMRDTSGEQSLCPNLRSLRVLCDYFLLEPSEEYLIIKFLKSRRSRTWLETYGVVAITDVCLPFADLTEKAVLEQLRKVGINVNGLHVCTSRLGTNDPDLQRRLPPDEDPFRDLLHAT